MVQEVASALTAVYAATFVSDLAIFIRERAWTFEGCEPDPSVGALVPAASRAVDAILRSFFSISFVLDGEAGRDRVRAARSRLLEAEPALLQLFVHVAGEVRVVQPGAHRCTAGSSTRFRGGQELLHDNGSFILNNDSASTFSYGCNCDIRCLCSHQRLPMRYVDSLSSRPGEAGQSQGCKQFLQRPVLLLLLPPLRLLRLLVLPPRVAKLGCQQLLLVLQSCGRRSGHSGLR
mmetsp:Transcript_35547/g.53456  ORF Transcript_35547/g.53456 Transcript_35547/m.53456 type:complete len:233 (-) Transcript_35547:383-1081(-)